MSAEKKAPSFFAAQIRLLRKQMKLTQKDVADVLGISQSYISRLEKRILSRLREEIKDKI